MQSTTYKCDGCGAVKRESNHWLHAADDDARGFVIVKWGNRDAEFLNDFVGARLDLCGMDCAIKAMAKAMQGG